MDTRLHSTQSEFFSKKKLEDRLQFLTQFAHAAPSRNNTKPWKLEIKGDKIFIFADFSKRLDVTDPFNRELYISLGAVIANLEIAAEHFQLYYDAYIFTREEVDNLVAVIKFSLYKEPKSTYPVPLFDYIPLRHTARKPYSQSQIDKEDLRYIADSVNWIEQISLYITENNQIKNYLASLTYEAELDQFNNPLFKHEQTHWITNGRKNEGVPLSSFHLSPMSSMLFTISHDYNIGNDKATFDANLVRHSPAVAIIMSDNDEKADWISTGIAFETLALRITALGLSYQPMTSTIEVPHIRHKIRDLIESTKVPQMFLRIGYPEKSTFADSYNHSITVYG